MHGRLPFHDELVELFSLPYVLSFYKRIPFEYRVWLPLPQKNAFTTNIHTTARLAAEVRSAYDDGEGEEDDEFLRKEEEMRRAQKEYEKKVKREKKKLEKRQKKKNFQASTIVVPVDKEYEKYMETFVLKEKKEPGVYDPVVSIASTLTRTQSHTHIHIFLFSLHHRTLRTLRMLSPRS